MNHLKFSAKSPNMVWANPKDPNETGADLSLRRFYGLTTCSTISDKTRHQFLAVRGCFTGNQGDE